MLQKLWNVIKLAIAGIIALFVFKKVSGGVPRTKNDEKIAENMKKIDQHTSNIENIRNEIQDIRNDVAVKNEDHQQTMTNLQASHDQRAEELRKHHDTQAGIDTLRNMGLNFEGRKED